MSEVVLEQISGKNVATGKTVQTRVWRVRYAGIFVGILHMDHEGPISFIQPGLLEEQKVEIISQVAAILRRDNIDHVEVVGIPEQEEDDYADFEE